MAMKSRALATQRRAERRRDRVNRRAARRRQATTTPPMTAADREMLDRFDEAFLRWNAHRGEVLHDTCPSCHALVIITPRVAPGATEGAFDAAHTEPVCDEFLLVMLGIAMSEPQITTRKVS
jgi:hypothetical protein